MECVETSCINGNGRHLVTVGIVLNAQHTRTERDRISCILSLHLLAAAE